MYASSALAKHPWHYVEQIVVGVSSEQLDAQALGQAWTDLSAAHPALRNVIVNRQDGDPQQYSATPFSVVPVVQDWQDRDPAQSDAALQQFLEQDRTAGIDATTAPSFRVAIFHTGASHSVMVWSFPHSLLDGRAFAPLLDEVFTRYNRIKSGGNVPAPEPPEETLFEAHCRQLAAMDHTRGEDHFAQSLAGWEGTEGLLRDDAKASRKKESHFQLSAAKTKTIARLAAQTDVTSSTIILAAWGIVLARFTGQAEVVFGATRNGRHIVQGSADAAGCFITTVPMRLRLDRAVTLGDLLKRLREEQVALRPFEHTPLTNISRRLGLAPGRSLFDSVLMFDFGTLQDQLKALGGGWLDRQIDLYEEGDTPVSVAAYMGDELKITVEYDPAQVPDGPRLGQALFQLLAQLDSAMPETLLPALSMLDTDAQQEMITLAGATPSSVSQDTTCIDRFEQIAAQQPDHIALVQPEVVPLTYGALDRAADNLSANLSATGVQKGDTIGICMTRSPAFITAMLAIWKCGAAFVPMDPTYPQATLDIIAQDSGARLILTDDAAPTLSAPTYHIDSLSHTAVALPKPERRSADDLAYVIFTSGSTGRPKGVMITHRSLAAHAEAIIPHFGLTPPDRVLQFAALSFDVALEEIVPTLLSGATLVLRSDAMAQSVPAFLAQLDALEITVTNLPTGFWIALTDVLDRHDAVFPAKVRLVIVGGERVPLSALKRWRARLPDVRWLNGYGPTETTITCTTHEATLQDMTGDTVPIGRPLSHARAWVLAKDGSLLPQGVEGELYISGPAVAKGYMGDPVRTENSFGQAQFAPDIGRIYATGDRVKWQGGVLHYLGRMDRQIKLRGFRIEPGQIEAALETQEGVDRAHADVMTNASGRQQLVAWFSVSEADGLPAPETLNASIAGILPPQMRPVLVQVSTWPQTPGGKVDAARLPPPELTSDTPLDSDGLDGTLAAEVAQLFRDILQSDNIGPQTSFFDAGGDSLSLLRLMPELERAFNVTLEPTSIYSDPTPHGVASALIAQDPDPLVVIPIQEKGTFAPLYAVHVLGDNGSYFRPLSRVLGDEQPVFGLTVGLLSNATPTTVPDIAQFYLRQIERHHPKGPLSLIAVSAGSYVTLELAQLLQKAGRDVQALILLDAEGPAGRARVGRAARVGVHAGEILRHGWPYIAKQLGLRQEARAQDLSKQKFRSEETAVAEVHPDEWGDVNDFVAANQIAIEAYEPQPYNKRLTIFRAGDDKFDSKEAILNGLGWAPVAQAGFDLTDIPGDHLGILAAPNVEKLGTEIAALLLTLRKAGD
jgi:amino acid adenylation domain-containing protein